MNSLQIVDGTDLANLSMTPVIVNPVGKKLADRISSVLVNADGATALALIGEKGAVGKLARAKAGQDGVMGLIQHAANFNYRPLAEWLAIKLNGAVLVRNRSEYEMLPTILDMRIMDAESKGTVSGVKLADKLRGIKSDVVEIQRHAQALFDKRRADILARKQEALALADAAGVLEAE